MDGWMDMIDAALEAGCTDNVTVILAGGRPRRPIKH
jgi:serine/threonine protein phosphatase PrpC